MKTLRDIATRQYRWTLDIDDNIAGLTAGDQGYETANVKLADLVGTALTATETRGRASRDWRADLAIQDALDALIKACLAALPERP